eukprot:SAG31_NODE_9280_length_1305_cov_1.870647_1_plen_364_part_10
MQAENRPFFRRWTACLICALPVGSIAPRLTPTVSNIGRFEPFQSFGIPRTGAYGMDTFQISGYTFLALANFFGNESVVYKWNGSAFALHQPLPSHAGHAFKHFEMPLERGSSRTSHFLALANYRTGFKPGDPQGWPQGPWFWPPKQTNSTIFRFDESTQRFVRFQSLETSFANAWTAFLIRGQTYLAVANSHSLAAAGKMNSTVYRYDGVAQQFVAVQAITTYTGLDVESFTIRNQTYLAFANTESKAAGFLVKSAIYRWSDAEAKFVLLQLLPTSAATGITFFAVPDAAEPFLAVANRYGKTGHRENSMIFQWHPELDLFRLLQSIPTKGMPFCHVLDLPAYLLRLSALLLLLQLQLRLTSPR